MFKGNPIGNPIICLKPKIDGKETNTAKWVNIATEFNEYKNILFNKKAIKHKMRRSQSKKHKIGIYEVSKTSLCFSC